MRDDFHGDVEVLGCFVSGTVSRPEEVSTICFALSVLALFNCLPSQFSVESM